MSLCAKCFTFYAIEIIFQKACKVGILTIFYRWGNWSSETLSTSVKVICFQVAGSGLQPGTFLIPKPISSLYFILSRCQVFFHNKKGSLLPDLRLSYLGVFVPNSPFHYISVKTHNSPMRSALLYSKPFEDKRNQETWNNLLKVLGPVGGRGRNGTQLLDSTSSACSSNRDWQPMAPGPGLLICSSCKTCEHFFFFFK